MLIHCPSCNTEYDCAPGQYECECGAKFSVSTDGSLSETDSNKQPAEFDIEKTIPPRREREEATSDVTMPGKRDRAPDGRFEIGDLILGRYKVLLELGQGGMGVVYKCFDEIAGIEIALKALPPELSHNTMEMEDVKENFQLVSRLVHQNIAISKNLEKDSSTGNYYLIMECIEGEDLRRWIRKKRKESTLSVEIILPVIRQVAAALDYAHEQKIIHRDIKPGNIMIDQAGHVKVLDFGLAAQIHTSMTRVSMAYHGTSGTAPYMAPEQWRGRAQGAAADQYALAVMTYEMLAGRLPFESTDASVLREAVLNEAVGPVPGIPEYAQHALMRGMSKEPADRFNSCTDFAEALGGEKMSQRTGHVSRADAGFVDRNKLPPWMMNKKTLGILAGAIVVLVVLIIALSGNSGSGSSRNTNTSLQERRQTENLEDSISRQVQFSSDGKTLLKAPASIVRYSIPNGATKIGKEAFKDCKSLTSITIPKSVTEIGPWAFYSCESLTNVTIPNGVTTIGRFAFAFTGLTSVTIPNSVREIDVGAFEHCGKMTSATIPNSITEIASSTFECTGLTTVTIPDNVTKIGTQAFRKCKSLKSITIPGSVTEIGSSAFVECESLTNVKINNGVNEISEYAFSGCKALKSITIPNSVTAIQAAAFQNCESLSNVTIPSSVGAIYERSFRNCKSLKSIQIPNKKVFIRETAFEGAGCEAQVKRDYSDRFSPAWR